MSVSGRVIGRMSGRVSVCEKSECECVREW